MQRQTGFTFLLVVLLAFVLTNLIPPRRVLAAPSAYDLIAAVQALRSSKGLPPLIVDAALMSAAQGHSNYQASIGTFSHTGAGGTSPTDRARAAGFGGGATVYISENVAIGNSLVGLNVIIYEVWADPDHWKTMTSPLYIRAGAGVTEKNGVVYYTLDTGYLAGQAGRSALPTNAAGIATQVPKTPTPTVPLIVPIHTSTPNPDGSVIHPVGYGQALINIATAYGLKLDDLRKRNGMTASSVLRAGQKLLIQPSSTPTRVLSSTPSLPPPTGTPTATRTPTLEPTRTAIPSATPTLTPTPLVLTTPLDNLDRRDLGIGIITVCGLGLLLVAVTQLRKKG